MSDTPTFDSTITTAKHADDTSTHIDADRATVLLASGPVAGRDWRELTRAEEDGDG